MNILTSFLWGVYAIYQKTILIPPSAIDVDDAPSTGSSHLAIKIASRNLIVFAHLIIESSYHIKSLFLAAEQNIILASVMSNCNNNWISIQILEIDHQILRAYYIRWRSRGHNLKTLLLQVINTFCSQWTLEEYYQRELYKNTVKV